MSISVNDAKLRYWRLQRQSDLALSVLRDLIRARISEGVEPATLATELKLSEQFIKDAVKDVPHGDDAFTYAMPDGSYIRRWYSQDHHAMTWYGARAGDLGFGDEIGPFATMEEAIAALG